MTITTIPAPLLGKVAIITGASRGIGEATALQFAERGCSHIAITYLQDAAAAESVLSKLRDINPSIKTAAFQADCRDREFGRRVIQESLQLLLTDRIDILVSNAGIQDIREYTAAAETKYEDFEKCMVGHAWAPLSLCVECIPYMPPGGRIIMNSAASSKMAVGDPLVSACASKAAMDAIARNLAVVYGQSKGVTVNSIGCGATETETLKRTLRERGEQLGKYTASLSILDRIGRPEEVASIISFVASPEASWINGECLASPTS